MFPGIDKAVEAIGVLIERVVASVDHLSDTIDCHSEALDRNTEMLKAQLEHSERREKKFDGVVGALGDAADRLGRDPGPSLS
jgi:hypothetical protein